MEKNAQTAIVEAIRDLRSEMKHERSEDRKELREFKREVRESSSNVREELRAINAGIKATLGVLEMQQDIGNIQSGRIDWMETELQRLNEKAEYIKEQIEQRN